MSNKEKIKFLSLRNPGIIMVLIQVVMAIIIFAWFPLQPSLYGFPLVAWLMFAAYFITGIKAAIYMFWVRVYEKKLYGENKGGVNL